MKILLLIDGNALIHRAFHALPDFHTRAGVPTNAVYGFATILHKAITDFKPTHIEVCLDTAAPTFRDKLFVEYRVQRPEINVDLKSQFPLVKEFLEAANIKMMEKDGLEADDILAILKTRFVASCDRIIILTGDRDILQLVDDKTVVVTPQLGYSKAMIYDPGAVEEKFGVKPEQIADLKALAGDQSDNYKGVAGIGPKTAANLVRQFGSVENLYENLDSVESEKTRALLVKYKKDALMAKKLAKLVTHDHLKVTLAELVFSGYNENLKEFFKKMEFNTIANRFFPTAKKSAIPKPKKEEKKQLGLF